MTITVDGEIKAALISDVPFRGLAVATTMRRLALRGRSPELLPPGISPTPPPWVIARQVRCPP